MHSILLLVVIGLAIARLAISEIAPSIQVALALRSESIVLVQLGDGRKINYTIQTSTDQDYQDFMAMMRHEQADTAYLDELDLLEQYPTPIYNHTVRKPAYPVTNFHYSHMIARNLRPIITQATAELGCPVKCDIITIPGYRGRYTYEDFVRLASEIAGCGRVGPRQIGPLHRAVHSAYEWYMIDSERPYWDSGFHKHRLCLLIEIETTYVRLSMVGVMLPYSQEHCTYTCDRGNANFTEWISTCIAKFKTDCLVNKRHPLPSFHGKKITSKMVEEAYISGNIGSHLQEIYMLFGTHFGHSILDRKNDKFDVEVLGAYGAAFRAQIRSQFANYRDEDLWNRPVFLVAYLATPSSKGDG